MEAVKIETYFRCKKCGTEIPSNTHKRYTLCKCEAIAIDSCEYYARLIGNREDIEQIQKDEKGIIKISSI
jgi:hypothetical protein